MLLGHFVIAEEDSRSYRPSQTGQATSLKLRPFDRDNAEDAMRPGLWRELLVRRAARTLSWRCGATPQKSPVPVRYSRMAVTRSALR